MQCHVAVTDPLRDPLPEHVRADYEAALSRIGAYGIYRERSASEGLHFAILVGMEGNFFHRAFVHFVWTDGPAPKGQEPVADDPDFTRYDPLGDGWFVRWGTM